MRDVSEPASDLSSPPLCAVFFFFLVPPLDVVPLLMLIVSDMAGTPPFLDLVVPCLALD